MILLPPAATMPIHLYPVARVFDDGVGGWRSSGLGSSTIKQTTCPVPCQTLTLCQHDIVHAAADNHAACQIQSACTTGQLGLMAASVVKLSYSSDVICI